jgi:hypothetical protein
MMTSLVFLILAMLLAPIYAAWILKVKAFFGGRKGSPLLINYYTLIKLLKKGSVYSTSTTVIFKMGPSWSFCAATMVLLFLPIAGQAPLFSFNGDVILCSTCWAWDAFSPLPQPWTPLSLRRHGGGPGGLFSHHLRSHPVHDPDSFLHPHRGAEPGRLFFRRTAPGPLAGSRIAPLLFVVIALFIILLTENSRVPVDDPATHLELTMIHEVMVLDHSGPDFAFIELGSFSSSFSTRHGYPPDLPFELGHPAINLPLFSVSWRWFTRPSE